MRTATSGTATSRISRSTASLGLVASLVLSLLGASALLLAPPAAASFFLRLTPPPDAAAPIPPGGLQLSFGYAVTSPGVSWKLDVTLIHNGARTPVGSLAGAAGPASGTSAFSIPPGAGRVGVYTLNGTFTWTDADGVSSTSSDDNVQFRLEAPPSRTRLSATPRRTHFGGEVHFTSTSSARTLTGFRRLRGASVELQGLNKGHWVSLDTAVANARGKARWIFTWRTHRRSLKIRAVTQVSSQANSQSVSRPVTIHSH